MKRERLNSITYGLSGIKLRQAIKKETDPFAIKEENEDESSSISSGFSEMDIKSVRSAAVFPVTHSSGNFSETESSMEREEDGVSDMIRSLPKTVKTFHR